MNNIISPEQKKARMCWYESK